LTAASVTAGLVAGEAVAVTDNLRMRELGVPRYNAFRTLVHLAAVKRVGLIVWIRDLRHMGPLRAEPRTR
jgi:hypothetical protein